MTDGSVVILSFHPIFEGDQNRLCAGREPDQEDLAAIKSAQAVILPQGCSRRLYEMALQNCAHIFPNYDLRFQYPGKVGQIELFKNYGIPHPESIIVEMTPDLDFGRLGLSYPLVVKRNWGGEGFTVYWVENRAKLDVTLKKILVESAEPEKVLLQTAVPGNQGRVMRVVSIGEFFKAYWRIALKPDERIVHLEGDGRIDDSQLDPEILLMAESTARQFCERTGVNLVGIDYLFDYSTSIPQLLMIELNYFFGRKGLGGSQAYYTILTREIQKWCQRTIG